MPTDTTALTDPVAEVVERLNAETIENLIVELHVIGDARAFNLNISQKNTAEYRAAELLKEAQAEIERLSRERDTGVPEGWCVLPLEPTREMCEAAVIRDGGWLEPYTAPRESGVAVDGDLSQEDADDLNRQSCEDARLDYIAMLSAAPQPPQTGAPKRATELCQYGHCVLNGPDVEGGDCVCDGKPHSAAPQHPTVSTQGWQENAVAVLEEIDAAFDKQIYCLPPRPDPTPFAMREADQDIPPDYEHSVIVTEALWDKIRAAISAPGRVDLSTLTRERDQAREALQEIAFGNYTEFSEDSVSSHGLLQIVGHMQEVARSVLHPEKEEKA
jgi:hypothetical protein